MQCRVLVILLSAPATPLSSGWTTGGSADEVIEDVRLDEAPHILAALPR